MKERVLLSVGKEEVKLPNGKMAYLEKVEDPKITEMASYLIKGYKAFSALKKGPQFPEGLTVEVYGTNIPIFHRTEKGAFYSGVTIPKEGENYVILIDERLEPHEKLAVLDHELGHIAGGFKSSDKEAQKIAIQNLGTLLNGYELLSQEKVRMIVKRDAGVNYNPEDIPREEVKDALQYLVTSGAVFDVGPQEWKESGLKVRPSSDSKGRKRKGGLEEIFSVVFIFIGLFLLMNSYFGITGFYFIENFVNKTEVSLLGLASLVFGFMLFLIIKRKSWEKTLK